MAIITLRWYYTKVKLRAYQKRSLVLMKTAKIRGKEVAAKFTYTQDVYL